MKDKGRHPGTAIHTPEIDAPLALQIGQEVVNIWFDAEGIHFRHPGGRSTEGILPWDLAMAMSLVPENKRRPLNTPAA
jgi:hypothetical protein